MPSHQKIKSPGGRTVKRGLPRGGDLISTMPVCVCPKLKDMGPFSASSECNE